MTDKWTTTTPDPELFGKQGDKDPGPIEGGNPRDEVAGCPTALSDPAQKQAPQRPGGGGAPGTGEIETDPSVRPSVGDDGP